MANEVAVDVVYRSGLQDFDSPTNKTIYSVAFDGFGFVDDDAAAANPATIKVYSFDNQGATRGILNASTTLEYDDIVNTNYVTIYPIIHGKQFVFEFNSGIDDTTPTASFVDFFGEIRARVVTYTREVANR